MIDRKKKKKLDKTQRMDEEREPDILLMSDSVIGIGMTLKSEDPMMLDVQDWSYIDSYKRA